MFRALIAERFPDHAGARARKWAAPRPRPPGPCWVFDPIDGTTNFAHGLPIFCSSLALEIDGVAEVGADLRSDAQGAVHRRARRRRVPERPAAARLVAPNAGRRHARHRISVRRAPARRRDRRPVRRLRRQARAVRRLGSAAIDLCYVAAGRMDGFWESDLKPWDIAGGALIVAEAGGRVTTLSGQPFASRGGDVLATNGRLHDAMLDVHSAEFRSVLEADGLIPARDNSGENTAFSTGFSAAVLAFPLLLLSQQRSCGSCVDHCPYWHSYLCSGSRCDADRVGPAGGEFFDRRLSAAR